MIILGIESSCDETAASVVDMGQRERRILSNVVASQIETHALYGGVVPEIASRAHIEAVSGVVKTALSQSGVRASELEAIGVTYTPGLIGSLLVGVNFAKSMAFSLKKPLVPVDHIKAHTAAAYFSENGQELSAPFLSLVVSGGHTSIYRVDDPAAYEEIGSTRDDAAGEAFDKVGRIIGLPYPGGAAMDRLASLGFEDMKGEVRKIGIRLPSPAISDDSLDFSFSGLKTAAVNYVHSYRQRESLDEKAVLPEAMRRNLAAVFTQAVVGGICEKLDRALEYTKASSLVLAGGVAANSHLRRGVAHVCQKRGVKLFVPPVSLCGDNGVMVAAQAYFEYAAGVRASTALNAYASGESAENADGVYSINQAI